MRPCRCLWTAESPPHGGADRNLLKHAFNDTTTGSPPHGGADRNAVCTAAAPVPVRRPLTGARIETAARRRWPRGWPRRPPRRQGFLTGRVVRRSGDRDGLATAGRWLDPSLPWRPQPEAETNGVEVPAQLRTNAGQPRPAKRPCCKTRRMKRMNDSLRDDTQRDRREPGGANARLSALFPCFSPPVSGPARCRWGRSR